MTLKSTLMATIFGFSIACAASDVSALPISGTSEGSFSNNSAGVIFDTDHGANTGLSWGLTSEDPPSSILAAADVLIADATDALGVIIGRLDWFNQATPSSTTPFELSVDYTLTLDFQLPSASTDTEVFNLVIANRINPTADEIDGLTLADLSGLSIILDGILVSNLRYAVEDLDGDSYSSACSGDDTSLYGTIWFNCEHNVASLYVMADFVEVAVPEPATLAVFGTALIGLATIRRRQDFAAKREWKREVA